MAQPGTVQTNPPAPAAAPEATTVEQPTDQAPAEVPPQSEGVQPVKPADAMTTASPEPSASSNPPTPKSAPPPSADVLRQAELDKAATEEVPCVRIFTEEQNHRTVLVGNILTGIGGASFAASAVMFSLAFDRHKARESIEPGTNMPEVDERIDELERQRRGLIIAGIITGASSVALLAVGPPLMAVGYRREKARQGAQLEVPSLGFSRQRGRSGKTATRVDLAFGMRF